MDSLNNFRGGIKMSKETLTAKINLKEGLTVSAKSRGHEIIMDESKEMG